ncbi:hypothetical protein OG871_07255 [Kitasatospora sp. NBC_00374]|uniref:hypothetical protein n=1 Tax=Kitasatospora sp. NBC_00374 TaxID=2975964 RepID=UPI0030E0692D
MALLKSTTVDQVAEAVRRADPTDRLVVTLAALPGGSPWTHALICGQFDIERYFLTLTERAVMVHDIKFLRHRPGRLLHRIPRAEAARGFTDLHRRMLWSYFRFHLPGEAQATRLNVRRAWRPELDRLAAALTAEQPAAPAPVR